MFSRFPTHPSPFIALALGTACAVIGLMLLDEPFESRLFARASYDVYFRWFDLGDAAPSPSPVTIVYLDLDSHLRERHDPTKPWPRALHARLLQRLKVAGAKAVVFDVIFDRPGADAAADGALAAALREHSRTVIAGEISVSSQSSGEGAWVRLSRVVEPLTVFRDSSAAWGLGEIGVDEDFVARRHFAGRTVDGAIRPSLSSATAQLLGMSVANETGGARWLRYYGPPFTLPHVSFSQALDPAAVDDSAFKDKIVFIGARPMASLLTERRDEFRSPFRSWRERDLFMPGVEVHATQMLNLLRDDWLRRAAPWNEKLLLIATGVLGAFVLMLLRPLAATGAALGLAAGTAGASYVAFVKAGLWFPWLIVVAVQLPLALGGSVLAHSIEWYQTRRRLEAARRVAESRIREQAALIDKAQDAILVADLAGTITYANPSAERLYLRTREQLHSGAIDDLFAPSVGVARQTTIERGEWRGDLQTRATGRTPALVESRWTLLRDESGAPHGLLLINSDVTEKRRLEAETIRMQRMDALGSLAGGMAHDLNNALAPILMGTQLLRRDARDENAARVLGLMEASTRRGAEMVRQVLAFARGRRGEFEPIDAGQLVREMEKLARDTFPKNLQVSGHVANDLWPVSGDATQLHQVLLNLCVNARDAMPHGGALALAADNVTLDAAAAGSIQEARPGEFVVLMVSDTGTGMSPEIRARLFEPFFTTKAEGAGTGLGLSTTARLVKAHGGFIAVQSEPGEGTTFEVYLPRLPDNPAAPARADDEPWPRGNGETILIAEDDAAVRELLCRTLEAHGYRVLATANGAEALAVFREQAAFVELVICDMSMPVLDGPQAAEEMRKISPGLPVLLMGGESGGRATPAGPGVLVKPVEIPILLRTVSQSLASRRAQSPNSDSA